MTPKVKHCNQVFFYGNIFLEKILSFYLSYFNRSSFYCTILLFLFSHLSFTKRVMTLFYLSAIWPNYSEVGSEPLFLCESCKSRISLQLFLPFIVESNQAVLEEYKNKLMDRIRSQGKIVNLLFKHVLSIHETSKKMKLIENNADGAHSGAVARLF